VPLLNGLCWACHKPCPTHPDTAQQVWDITTLFDVPTSFPDEDVMLPQLINPNEPPSAGSEDNPKNTQKLLDKSVSIKDQILNIINPHPNFSRFLMNVWCYS
jgi:hypothetical protein